MSLRQGTDSADTESVENDGVVLISFDLEKNLATWNDPLVLFLN